MCEEIDQKTEENVNTIATYVNVISLHDTMFECYLLANYSEIGELAHDTAIKTHNLLKHMEDFKGIKTGS